MTSMTPSQTMAALHISPMVLPPLNTRHTNNTTVSIVTPLGKVFPIRMPLQHPMFPRPCPKHTADTSDKTITTVLDSMTAGMITVEQGDDMITYVLSIQVLDAF